MEQKIPSLEEYRQELIESVGQAQTEKIISQLTVKEHNPIYKDRNRAMPRAVFTVNGTSHTLKGTSGRYKGQPCYYVSEDGTKHKCKNCSIQKHNSGINFLQEIMV